MQFVARLVLAAAALSPLGCRAHWRLTKPVPRSGGAYENNPLPSNTQESWVCRNPSPNPSVPRPTLVAGSSTTIEYGTAPFGHVGDCAVYLSYDTGRSRRAMRWVKVANLPDCRAQINTEVPIALPGELPAGDAVLRWDQYALHQGTMIEWYTQCADVTIESASARSWDSFNSFSMIDNGGRPAYPSSLSSYRRSTAVPGDADYWMTGPACVDDRVNQCSLTAVGTKGYSGFGGEAGGAAPAPPAPPMPAPISPSPAPVPWMADPAPSPYGPAPAPYVPAPAPSVPAPAPYVPAPAPGPSPSAGDCVSSGPAYYAAACQALAATCEQQSFCRRASPGASSPAPTPAGGACVSSGPSYYDAACQALAATCEQYSFCKRASLTQTSSLRQVRLRTAAGHVLLQQDMALEGRPSHQPLGLDLEAAGEGRAGVAGPPQAARAQLEL